MRPISPSLSSKTAHEESHGSGAESVFIASGNVSTAGESGAGLDDNDAHENEEEKGVSDLVVNVPGETARWVFTDRPGQEDPIAMQVRFHVDHLLTKFKFETRSCPFCNSFTMLKGMYLVEALYNDVGPAIVLAYSHRLSRTAV